MEFYALVSDWSPQGAIDVYVRQSDAEKALDEAVSEEPSFVDLLSVVPIELDGWTWSSN